MRKIDFTFTSNRKLLLLLGLLFCSPWATSTVKAQTVNLPLDRNYKIERSDGTRLKQLSNNKCRNCSAKLTAEKLQYLTRVITENPSNEYQRAIELQIFADAKFVNGCWKKAIDKGMEFFFTVSETGVPSDFAWFPKERAGKCIKRHIASIEFPELNKPHHSWILVTGQKY